VRKTCEDIGSYVIGKGSYIMGRGTSMELPKGKVMKAVD
jgi:hypothetical protein